MKDKMQEAIGIVERRLSLADNHDKFYTATDLLMELHRGELTSYNKGYVDPFFEEAGGVDKVVKIHMLKLACLQAMETYMPEAKNYSEEFYAISPYYDLKESLRPNEKLATTHIEDDLPVLEDPMMSRENPSLAKQIKEEGKRIQVPDLDYFYYKVEKDIVYVSYKNTVTALRKDIIGDLLKAKEIHATGKLAAWLKLEGDKIEGRFVCRSLNYIFCLSGDDTTLYSISERALTKIYEELNDDL